MQKLRQRNVVQNSITPDISSEAYEVMQFNIPNAG